MAKKDKQRPNGAQVQAPLAAARQRRLRVRLP